MVKVDDFIVKMKSIKQQADKSKGRQKQQLLKCYHRMLKDLAQCYYIQNNDIEYIKVIKR